MKYKKNIKSKLIPSITLENLKKNILKKPNWLKVKFPINSNNIKKIKNILRKNKLSSVCEEASCPNLPECFNHGTATFMILGTLCTRPCSFCSVNYGRPQKPDPTEPKRLADTVIAMNLNYVVITSVTRDDLFDKGAKHFANCIKAIRKKTNIKIEILVPDFKGKIDYALKILTQDPPDIFNHNLENVPRLYKKIRPGANYQKSLELLKKFKLFHPKIPTKSGLMVGLGETQKEIISVMLDLRNCGVNMITIGQYLQPNLNYFPVQKYVTLKEFENLKNQALSMGFNNVFCGPLVRSSYHAHIQSICSV